MAEQNFQRAFRIPVSPYYLNPGYVPGLRETLLEYVYLSKRAYNCSIWKLELFYMVNWCVSAILT